MSGQGQKLSPYGIELAHDVTGTSNSGNFTCQYPTKDKSKMDDDHRPPNLCNESLLYKFLHQRLKRFRLLQGQAFSTPVPLHGTPRGVTR